MQTLETSATATERSLLLREIQTLAEAEKKLQNKREAIHADELSLMFSLGQKIEALRLVTPHGRYKVDLAEIGIVWKTANRKQEAFRLFGQYRLEPWINNFGKSALQELAHFYYQKESKRGAGLVEEAIELAKAGTEVGVAWVFARIEGRKAQAGQVKTRFSNRLRDAIYEAVEKHGEEKVLGAIASLSNATETQNYYWHND